MAKDKTGILVLNQTDPHLGDTITFTSSGGKMINVTAYQAGLGVVWAEEHDADAPFVLGGLNSEWKRNGGSVSVVAWLYNRDMTQYVATTSFIAAG